MILPVESLNTPYEMTVKGLKFFDSVNPILERNRYFYIEILHRIRLNYMFLHLSNPVSESHLLNAPFGLPTSIEKTSDLYLTQNHYVIGYNPKLRIPMFVTYCLTADDLLSTVARSDCFRRDIRLSAKEASFCADYKAGAKVFDKGQLASTGK